MIGKSRYRVEGEIGRFEFALYEVRGETGEELFTGAKWRIRSIAGGARNRTARR